MKIKNIIYLVLSLSIVFLFNSCDEVSAPYEKNSSSEPSIDSSSNLTKILLEEYTGFKCNNCPKGARIAHSLMDAYSDRSILVSIHSGYFAKPDKSGNFTYDFRTDVGEELCSINNVSSFPCGTISRTPFNNEKIINGANWASAVQTFFETYKTAPVDIKITPNLSESQIDVTINLTYSQAASSQNYLSVWITEDGIKYWQIDKEATPPEVEDYIHNCVLRYSFNGTWGDLLSPVDIAMGTKIEKKYSYSLPKSSDWNLNNLKIVAFVYDNQSDGRVLQAKEVKLKS